MKTIATKSFLKPLFRIERGTYPWNDSQYTKYITTDCEYIYFPVAHLVTCLSNRRNIRNSTWAYTKKEPEDRVFKDIREHYDNNYGK